MPEISVIIPTYQHGDTIAKCLDSVFGQTFKDTEVIVVNDGSTDDTDTAVRPYLDRIVYKKIDNSGAPKARNAGFALSSGRFVIFLDADVVMRPEMLSELISALKDNPQASYAYCGFRFGIARFKGEKFSADRLRRMNFIHTSALIRREDFPGFDESLSRFQDWDLWLTMLEKGKSGIGINKTLFKAEPRSKFGMSKWRPKFFFSPLLDALGIKPPTVIKYRASAAVIANKHGLDLSPKPGDGSRLWIAFLSIFAASALSFRFPAVGTILAAAIAIAALLASRKRLVYGSAMVLAELIFGSLAGKTMAISLLGASIPLRFVLFAAVGAVWLARLLQSRVRWPQKNILIGVTALLCAVGWGIANGLARGTGLKTVFFDANAYFFLPIILVFSASVENEQDQEIFKKFLKGGAVAISVLTLAALYFFSHAFWNPAGVYAYKWLRDSRIAEITALSGGTYRIFMQSQIFCLLAFIYAAFGFQRGQTPYHEEKGSVPLKKGWKLWIWGVLPASALLVSGSRSFALGLVSAAIAWAAIKLSSRRADNSSATTTFAKVAVFTLGAIIAYAAILFFPLPQSRSQASFQDMLRSRSVSQRDAATASRWSLLKVLNEKIMQSPITGSGFGASITYRSSDPRIISTTGGSYTTSAFEWNYHDILVKMGIFGLLAYGLLLWAAFSILMKTELSRRIWLVPAFFALITLNAVSPYLNHPLGIGYLGLLLALAESKRGSAAPVAAAETIRKPAAAMNAMPANAALSEKQLT